jgi:CRP/FNR family transcriptional regulator
MILRLAGAGSVLGMSAAFSEEPYETTVEALEPCHVRVLRTSALAVLLRDYPQVAVAMARTLAGEYKAAFEEARRIALPTSPAGRIACLFMDWLASEKGARKADTITVTLTHDELASMTATTRETVTRTLSRFKKDGIIKTHGVAFTVLQPSVLQELSAC